MTPLDVLLVDDEAEIRNLLMQWLEHEGHQVTCAANGIEAAEISQAKEFDLVITDMLMPESDGVKLISEIKKTRPNVRVIAISGGGRVLESTDCLRLAKGLGAHAVVMKPFKRVQIMSAITQLMAPQSV